MAETKTSKVKELKHLDRQDNYGNWSHVVTFDNGDSGFCNTKDKEGATYAEGKELTYQIEEKTSKDGTKKYYTIKAERKMGGPYVPRTPSKGANEFKAEASMKAAELASNIIAIKEGVSIEDFPKYYKAFLNQMWGSIDQVYAKQ